MKKHIILGMLGDDEDAESKVIKAMDENGIQATVLRKHTKLGVKGEVLNNLVIDTLILVENLETARPYIPKEIEELAEIRDDLKIILILSNDRKCSSYMEEIYARGIYTALFDEDSSFYNIADLIKNGRNKRNARTYYGIVNEPMHSKLEENGIIDTEKANQILSYLVNETEGTFKEKMDHVSQMLKPSEFTSLLRMMPNEIQEEVKKTEGYESCFIEVIPVQNKKISKFSMIMQLYQRAKEILDRPIIKKTKSKIILYDSVEDERMADIDRSAEIELKVGVAEEKVVTSKEPIISEQTENVIENIVDPVNSESIAHTKDLEVEIKKEIVPQTVIENQSEGPIEMEIEKPKSNKKLFRKRESKKANFEITITIAVCALEAGVGCSHVAKSLAYYIKHVLKKKVCIVDFNKNKSYLERTNINVYHKDEMYFLYDQYEYIILDIGRYDLTVQKEIKRAPLRIMCAYMEDLYLRKLAVFLKEEESAKKWTYFFNHVPASKMKKVDVLMEDYRHWCMPVYDEAYLDKNVGETFQRLLRGGRI